MFLLTKCVFPRQFFVDMYKQTKSDEHLKSQACVFSCAFHIVYIVIYIVWSTEIFGPISFVRKTYVYLVSVRGHMQYCVSSCCTCTDSVRFVSCLNFFDMFFVSEGRIFTEHIHISVLLLYAL